MLVKGAPGYNPMCICVTTPPNQIRVNIMRQFQMAFRIWKCLNFECNPIWICPWEFTWRLVQLPVTSDNTTRWRTRYYTKWRRLGLFILLIKSALKTSNDKAPSFLNTSTIYNNDVIMGAMVSQITSVSTVHSTVYSDADQRKYQSSASLAFVRGIHRWPVNSPHKGSVTRKMFPFDDVIKYCEYHANSMMKIHFEIWSFCAAPTQ